MTIFNPDYLVCQDSHSNKFYIACDLQNGKYLLGYGSLKNGAGTWRTEDAAKARDLVAGKTRKKYVTTDYSTLPMRVFKKFKKELMTQTGAAFATEMSDGRIDCTSPGSTGTQTAKPPRRARKSALVEHLHVWI